MQLRGIAVMQKISDGHVPTDEELQVMINRQEVSARDVDRIKRAWKGEKSRCNPKMIRFDLKSVYAMQSIIANLNDFQEFCFERFGFI